MPGPRVELAPGATLRPTLRAAAAPLRVEPNRDGEPIAAAVGLRLAGLSRTLLELAPRSTRWVGRGPWRVHVGHGEAELELEPPRWRSGRKTTVMKADLSGGSVRLRPRLNGRPTQALVRRVVSGGDRGAAHDARRPLELPPRSTSPRSDPSRRGGRPERDRRGGGSASAHHLDPRRLRGGLARRAAEARRRGPRAARGSHPRGGLEALRTHPDARARPAAAGAGPAAGGGAGAGPARSPRPRRSRRARGARREDRSRPQRARAGGAGARRRGRAHPAPRGRGARSSPRPGPGAGGPGRGATSWWSRPLGASPRS